MRQLVKNRGFRELIIELNTGEQLYDRGIDSTGKRLDEIGGGYAPYTILLKEMKAQPTDRVTLKDTGAFYRSFKVILNGQNEIEIIANTMKESTDLIKEWGRDIIGLTDRNLQKVIDMAREIIQDIIEDAILQAKAA